MHASARQHLHHVKGRQERGVFYLLFLLAYAFTVPITFLTCRTCLYGPFLLAVLDSSCVHLQKDPAAESQS
jgi:hypothetical protein